MSKPKGNPYLPESRQPLMACMNCKFREKDKNKDLARGGCTWTGASYVPPLHVCEAWQRQPRKRKEAYEE